MPNILLLDIETAPAKAYVWGLWNQNIGLNQIIEPGRIICWGAKWLGKKEFFYADERDGGLRMVREAHKLLSNADAVITYNGERFDLPRLRGAFVDCGLPPNPPVASIDLLRTVRTLGAQSNKLAYIGPHLRIGDKVNTGGFKLWADCLSGDPVAWDKMRKYNYQDVRLLEKLYNILKPYVKNHPRLFRDPMRPICGSCGSKHVQFRGPYYTKEKEYARFQCQTCRTWDRILVPKKKKAKGSD